MDGLLLGNKFYMLTEPIQSLCLLPEHDHDSYETASKEPNGGKL